jgi:outer membrane autotransporter protein
MKRFAANGKTGRTGDNGARTLEATPVARAVRAALGITAALLVLGGSGTAMAAGSCVNTLANTVSCNGAFTDTLPGTQFTPTVDLTLVLGDSLPTSVIPVFGAAGVDAAWGGLVDVVSFADITTMGADGIHAYGSTSASLTNNGSISTDITGTPGARAADVSAVGDVTIVNAGNIFAQSTAVEDVTSVGAFSSQGNVSVTNQLTGTIGAQAQDGNAIAIDASADLGTVTVENDGAIQASSVNGAAIGIRTLASAGDTTVTNTGSVSVVISAPSGNYNTAVGIQAASPLGTTTVTNAGTISVADTMAGYGGSATGINAAGGVATVVTNSGDIQTQGVGSYGIVAYTSGPNGTTTVTNTAQGTIEVTGKSAIGVRASSTSGAGTVINAGSIVANANYCGYFCYSGAVGVKASTINNTGSIVASQTSAAAQLGGVVGTYSRGYANVNTSITNTGSITATAAAYDGTATGVSGEASTGTTTLDNRGAIVATASGVYGMATGVHLSGAGDVDISNAGDIKVTAGRIGYGIDMFSEGFGHIVNTGTIEVTAAQALGIAAYTGGLVENAGHLTVTATGAAFGVSANSLSNALQVTNSGDLTVTSGLQAHGINAYVASGYAGATGSSTIDNSGTILVNAIVPPNSSYLQNTIGGAAYGANLVDIGGAIALNNTGSITARLYSNSEFANGLGRYQSGANGVIAYGQQDDIVITNAGSITASSEVNGTYFGTRARAVTITNDFGNVDLVNSGSITASAASDFRSDGSQTLAEGIFSTNFRGDTAIDNTSTGSIAASSSAPLYNAASATAINAYTGTGTIEITNEGAISAVARSGATSNDGLSGVTTATGVLVANTFGPSTSVGNAGSIVANAFADHYGAASALGIDAAVNYGSVQVTNTGAIAATALATTHVDASDAAMATAVSISNSSYVAGATTTFAGSGTATATATAEVQAIASGVSISGQDVGVTSSGIISASAVADATIGTALATGLSVTGTQASVVLGGGSQIAATAQGNNGAAIGLLVSSQNAVAVSNAGSITAAFIGAQGATYGAIVASGGAVEFTNAGHISVAQANNAVAVELSSPTVTSLINAGMISAGTGTGNLALLLGDATNTIDNGGLIDGSIKAGAGDDSLTNRVGAVWNTGTGTDLGAGNNSILNAGNINGAIQTGSGDDVFANLSGATWNTAGTSNLGDGNNTITNAGTITGAIQTGSGNDLFANLSGATWTTAGTSNFGDGNNTITNAGTITGAIQTGSGNDTFTNAIGALWNASGSSNFGGGADALDNAGTIALDNATIVINGAGSHFDNTGLITVLGNNRIDMGANQFTNNGTLDFQNGATNDVLTVAGNFGGTGKIAVDASGVHSASDRLFVEGNVAPGSVTTVNVHLLDIPATVASSIPIVEVGGTAAAGSFVLGTVTQPLSFVALAYADTLNVSAGNVFSLGVAVTGLSDVGTLAASVTPGVESLMNTQVGTLQQRMGAPSQTIKGGVSLWTRVFQDAGTIDPTHSSTNFGQGGNDAFRQTNAGGEVGVDFAVTDEIRFGGLLDQSQGDQRLNQSVSGFASSNITGHTYGGYGTWISPGGFYLDASYRRMNFEAKLRTAGGGTLSSGHASTFNVELGQQWTVGDGFKIEPQLQLTRTLVDSSDNLSGVAAGFRSDGDGSSRGRAGVQFSKSFVAANGGAVWTPSFAVSEVREFDGKNQYSVNNAFFGETSTRGSSALAEAGIDGKFGPLSIYAGLNWQDGGALSNVAGGQLGLRYAW